MKYIVELKYTNPSHEHVSLRRRVESRNTIVEAANEEEAILRASRQQRALGFMVKEAKIVEQKKNLSEEVEQIDESVATAQKVMDRANVVAKTNPDPKKRFAAGGLANKAMLRTINPTGVNTGITRGGGNKTYRKITGKVPPYQLTRKTGVSEEVVTEASKEGKDVMRSVRSSLKSMDLRHGVDSDKRDAGYKMSPAVKAAQAKSDALSKPVKRPQAGTLAAVHKSMEKEMQRNMKKEESVAESSSDYFRRREREEAIISGQKPARKKQPAQTSDYARRREREKRQGVAEEVEYIEEKLTATDPASKWISDFVASDNPKFAGKSKKERIRMALGAHYAAKREKNEAVEKYNEKEVKGDEKKQEKKRGSMNKLNMEPEMEANIQGVK